jgi:hypothetical protein
VNSHNSWAKAKETFPDMNAAPVADDAFRNSLRFRSFDTKPIPFHPLPSGYGFYVSKPKLSSCRKDAVLATGLMNIQPLPGHQIEDIQYS